MINQLIQNQGRQHLAKTLAGLICYSACWLPTSAPAAELKPETASSPKQTTPLIPKHLPQNLVIFRPRPHTDRPLQTAGAGTRSLNDPQSQCVAANSPGLALVVPQAAANFTATERPKFWFYLPKTQAQALEFSLFQPTPNSLGESETGIYQVMLPIQRQRVITSFTLPPEAPALADNQTYTWRVSLVCNPQNRLRDLRITGTITKIKLAEDQKLQLAQGSTLTRANLLASLGIWTDLLNTLSQDQQLMQVNWQNLLKSPEVQLDQLAEQTLTP
ncbi:MAG: DUF928 domain-containing protein [Pseudanabaenaceae cyanobacterium bins.68]|nr:DUF928 domain-containing protein [Pseudanabaenaceae cyanobacterium bins.68]